RIKRDTSRLQRHAIAKKTRARHQIVSLVGDNPDTSMAQREEILGCCQSASPVRGPNRRNVRIDLDTIINDHKRNSVLLELLHILLVNTWEQEQYPVSQAVSRVIEPIQLGFMLDCREYNVFALLLSNLLNPMNNFQKIFAIKWFGDNQIDQPTLSPAKRARGPIPHIAFFFNHAFDAQTRFLSHIRSLVKHFRYRWNRNASSFCDLRYG